MTEACLARVSLHIGDGSGGWGLDTCHGLAIASALFALHGNPDQGLVNPPKTPSPSSGVPGIGCW
jgi:hypothetical protein